MLKEFPPVVPALSLRDGLLVWVLAIAFGIIGAFVAGIFFVAYHLRAAADVVWPSGNTDKGTRG